MLREPGPGAWIERAAGDFAHRTALIGPQGRVDFRTLHDRLGAAASRWYEVGLEPGRPTAVISRHASRIAWAACLSLYAGVPLLPLDPRRGNHGGLLGECGIRQAWVDKDEAGSLSPRVSVFPADDLEEPVSHARLAPACLSSAAVQLFVATSGTSGVPRAVMLTGANLAASVRASRGRIDLQPGDVWLACLPLYHIGGLAILLRCLEAGATTLLHEGFSPARVWADLDAHAVTHISLVPAMLARLLDHAGDAAPPETLKTVLVGGGPLSGPLARRARRASWPLCVSYGLSEAGSQVATQCGLSEGWQAGDMGRPLDGARVEIVDDAVRNTDGVGRIRISGPTMMAGYANPKAGPGVGLDDGGFTSTDLGRIDERGHLRVLGRADDVIVSGGDNIHPAEVEARLADCPGIGEVAVTSRADAVWGERLVAVYTGPAEPTSLERWCRAKLASHLRPREFVRSERLPYSESGKLDRRGLRETGQKVQTY